MPIRDVWQDEKTLSLEKYWKRWTFIEAAGKTFWDMCKLLEVSFFDQMNKEFIICLKFLSYNYLDIFYS